MTSDRKTIIREKAAKRKEIIGKALQNAGKDTKWLSERTGISKWNLDAYLNGMVDLDQKREIQVLRAVGIDSYASVDEVKKALAEGSRQDKTEDAPAETDEIAVHEHISGTGPSSLYRNAGEMLKACREKKKISIPEICGKIRSETPVSPDLYDDWERDKYLPPQDVFIQLTKILSIEGMGFAEVSSLPEEKRKDVEKAGAGLRKKRAEKGMGIDTLAQKISGTRLEIECYEYGYSIPDEETQAAIRAALDSLPDLSRYVKIYRTPSTDREKELAVKFGKFLTNRCSSAGMNVKQVSDRVGISEWSLRKIRKGYFLPSKQLLERLECTASFSDEELYKEIPGMEGMVPDAALIKTGPEKTRPSHAGTAPGGRDGRKDDTEAEKGRPAAADTKTRTDKMPENMSEDESSVSFRDLASRFGMTPEEFRDGILGGTFSIRDEKTGRYFSMAPTAEDLCRIVKSLSREGRVKAKKALQDILMQEQEADAC